MSTVTAPDQVGRKITPRSVVGWGAVAVIGAACWSVLALKRGENVSALWILFAALSSYAIAYRFYARFIAYNVLGVDNTRATPAERLPTGATLDVTDRRALVGTPRADPPAAPPPGGRAAAPPRALPPGRPVGPRPGSIPTVLLVRAYALFISVTPSRASVSHIAAWLTETPCSRSIQARNSAIVASTCSATRARRAS